MIYKDFGRRFAKKVFTSPVCMETSGDPLYSEYFSGRC